MLQLVVGTLLSVFLIGDLTAQSIRDVAAQLPVKEMRNVVSVSFKDTPIDEAVRTIAQKSGITVTFVPNLLPDKRVSYRASDVTPLVALNSVLNGTNIRVDKGVEGSLVLVRVTKDKQGQGVIVGKVTDAKTGKSISGAGVSIGNDTRGSTTGEEGTYRLTGIPVGTHTVTVRLVGYAKQIRSVTVGEGATTTANFKLEPSVSVLDQVVVTGTTVATELKAVPNAITVVTAKQIEERGITRIDQLFRGDIPGLFSVNIGSDASLDRITMYARGATALSTSSAGVDPQTGNTNPIKTYIDGVELANPEYLSQIDPRSIERIEILTGPQASTIYGSNAINGVMQIFTKRGSGAKPQVILAINTGVVQNNLSHRLAPMHVVNSMVSGVEGRLSYNVGGSWDYTGAWTPGKQSQRIGANGSIRVQLKAFTTDVSARRGNTKNREFGNTQQELTNLRSNGTWEPSQSNGLSIPRDHTLDGNTMGMTLVYNPFNWWTHEVVIGKDISANGFMYTGKPYTNKGDTLLRVAQTSRSRSSERYNTNVQISAHEAIKLNLVLGADHWRTTGIGWNGSSASSLTGSLPDAGVTRIPSLKNAGAFVQGQLAIRDALFLTYGVRTDWNPNFGEKARVLPGRYGVSYTRDIGSLSIKARGSYGRSIRPPAAGIALSQLATELFIVPEGFGEFEARLANPYLGPEFQQGGEGGVELYLGSRVSLVITRFNQTVDNLISEVSPVDSVRSSFPNDGSLACSSFFHDSEGHCFYYQGQYLNVGSIRNQGWEFQGSINVGPIVTRGTYSWTKSRVIGITPRHRALLQATNPSFEPGRPVDYLPEHTWALNTMYVNSSSTISLALNGIGMLYRVGILSDGLSLASFTGRTIGTRPRMGVPLGYRGMGPAYVTADLNTTHRLSSYIDALLQVHNLTDYYQNDYSAQYATAGRQTRIGARVRW